MVDFAGSPPETSDQWGPSVFIAYARADSGPAGHIHLALSAALGETQIYLDTANPAPGTDWLRRIEAILNEVWVVICVVGSEFAQKVSVEESNLRRELEIALTAELTVLPVIVGSVPMPEKGALPPSLHRLTSIQAAYYRAETAPQDVAYIVNAVRGLLEEFSRGKLERLREEFPGLSLQDVRVTSPWTRQARTEVQRRAESGDADARHELGLRHFGGIGVRKDRVTGIRLLAQASEGGDTKATASLRLILESCPDEVNLAIAAFRGLGGYPDRVFGATALLRLWRRAPDEKIVQELQHRADNNDSEARACLSELYFEVEAQRHPMSLNPPHAYVKHPFWVAQEEYERRLKRKK
jgi:hypothetical protein